MDNPLQHSSTFFFQSFFPLISTPVTSAATSVSLPVRPGRRFPPVPRLFPPVSRLFPASSRLFLGRQSLGGAVRDFSETPRRCSPRRQLARFLRSSRRLRPARGIAAAVAAVTHLLQFRGRSTRRQTDRERAHVSRRERAHVSRRGGNGCLGGGGGEGCRGA